MYFQYFTFAVKITLCTGAEVPVQVVPEGIQSVNGSNETMGCNGSFTNDSESVTVCKSQSYLVDGCSPDIDTSTSDWASHLVTVRRNEGNSDVHHAHVLLTFGFETAVTLTGIEIDLFHCPEQGIGAPCITVYVNQECSLTFNQSLPFLPLVQPSQSSCDSLITVNISGDALSVSSVCTFHILVDLSHDTSIQWVYIGDVKFTAIKNTLQNACSAPVQSSSLVSTTALFTNGIHTCLICTCMFIQVNRSPLSKYSSNRSLWAI